MKTAIGIIGPIRAGKDFAGQYISRKLSLPLLEVSSSLKEICKERNIEPTRENLIQLGSELAKQQGDGVLAKYLVEKAPEAFIITGMRQLGQIEYLRKHTDFLLVAVDASAVIRFNRAQKDRKLGEANSLEEFIDRELKENQPPNKQRLFECMKLADITIVNEGSIEEFYSKLDELMKTKL